MISYNEIEAQTGWRAGVTVKRRFLYICSAFMVGMMIANVVRAESPAQAPAGASDGATAPPDMWREADALRLDGKR